MEKFIIVKDIVKKVKRFNLQGRTLDFKIKTIPEREEPVSWIRQAINQVITKGTEDLSPGDQVAFSFCSKDFQRGEGWVRFRPVEEVTYDDVWKVISSIYQSNSAGLNTENFCLGVTSVQMPAGKGKGRRYDSFDEECGMRRGIVAINNNDNMCLPRALVVAMSKIEREPEFAKVRRDIGKVQSQRALKLLTDASVSIPEGGCGIPELQKFQQHLQNYRIVVYMYGSKGRNVIFTGASEGPSLNLLYHKGHYNVIISLTSAFCCGYYCELCHVPYDTKNHHRCGGTCPACQQSPHCSQEVNITCSDCARKFRGQNCFENHKKLGSLGKSTVCKSIGLCRKCLKTVKRDHQHTCGEIYCKICNSHVPEGHHCFMQPNKGTPKTDNMLLIFYDLETRQEEQHVDGSLLHQPNLCVFKQCCPTCLNGNNKTCSTCGDRLHVLKHNVIESFMKFVLHKRKKFKHVVCIAHNGQAFDHQFGLNYILNKTSLTPGLIMRGTKIILMSFGNVKFIDSLNYFPMALAKLPKAFGLGDDFKKGYFPHLFNTAINENYAGCLPPIEFYSPDTMNTEDRQKLLVWHEEHKGDEFNMQKDIVEYCVSDVNILAAACLKFREQMMSTCNVCPFTEACTIASACNLVFRRNFLKPSVIGVIPKNGYRWCDNQSKVAIQWLLWEEKQRDINILHAAKQKEVKICGVKVDGYYEKTNLVFEFHGCYYHGCQNCFKFNRSSPLCDNPTETMNLRYESTAAKTDRLREFGYEVVEMWECQFRKLIIDNNDIEKYTTEHPLLVNTPLNPRDAFYGGRTGNTRTYYKCKPNETIQYIDVCSLYPWVCKYGRFPIKHPKVYIGKDCEELNLQNTNGLIKCKILPPAQLYHPVLPVKMNNKLMFALCRTCGEQMAQTDCIHETKERCLTGTWVIDEVLKALEKGYEMIEIYEIWKFDTEQYDKSKKVEGLFTSMMNKFIKIKQEASGWPKNSNTQEERSRYIQMFSEREDVTLKHRDIIENPGLRSLAKLMLNSFWGKLGQRENQPKTDIINNPEEFFKMLSNPSKTVNHVLPINEETLVVGWSYKDEAYDVQPTVNVTIAAYVTAQARLKLYSYLEKLGERVLYYDTDSVIYVTGEGDYEPKIGNFLGDMTNELEAYGPGSYITEFTSGGPKNYAYKVFSKHDNEEKVVCKVKGISLNYAASQLINFNSIKDMILEPSGPVYIKSKHIRRTAEHEVVTRTETKIYQPNSTKRRFTDDDHSSLPYGWKKVKLSHQY